MCMNTVTAIYDPPLDSLDLTSKARFGYKVFIQTEPGFFSSVYINGHLRYTADQWMQAEEGIILADDGIEYPSGFHVFRTRRSAETYLAALQKERAVIRRVEMRQIVASGTDGASCKKRSKVLIAGQMQICVGDGPRRFVER